TRKRDLALVSRLARQSGGFAWVKRDGNVRWRKIDTFAAFGMIGLKQIARRQSILRWREFAKRYRSLGDRARAYEANQLIARLALGRKPRCYKQAKLRVAQFWLVHELCELRAEMRREVEADPVHEVEESWQVVWRDAHSTVGDDGRDRFSERDCERLRLMEAVMIGGALQHADAAISIAHRAQHKRSSFGAGLETLLKNITRDGDVY